jgi:hypothetical protein
LRKYTHFSEKRDSEFVRGFFQGDHAGRSVVGAEFSTRISLALRFCILGAGGKTRARISDRGRNNPVS